MNKKDMIIKGYKGIMDLDLSLVPEKFIKIVIDQHLEDIKEYTRYQATLKPSLRYENTVERVNKQMKLEHYHRLKRIQREKDEERRLDFKLLNTDKKE